MSKWIDNEELQKTSSMHFAVLKSNPLLFDILEKAHQSITPDEMELLKQKWFGTTGMRIGQEDVGLTPEEHSFLDTKKQVIYTIDPDRLPFEAIKKNQTVGITADILERFGEKLGIEFKLLATDSWVQSLESVQKGESDILTMVSKTDKRSHSLDFTSPYMEYSVAIIVKDDYPFLESIQDLYEKKVAMVNHTNIWEMVEALYPQIVFVPKKNVTQCLLDVSNSRLEAAFLSLPVASHYIRNLGLTNLKVAGHTKVQEEIRIGVKKENQILHSIMSKLVRSIPQTEIDAIYRKWVVLKFEHEFDYALLWKSLSVAAVIILMIVFWNRKLVILNRKIAVAHSKLEEKSQELEQISVTDSLTGISNRRFLEKALESEIQRALRYGHTLSAIMIDLDFFKSVNDEFGHQTGDEVLQHFARLLKNNIRKTDLLGRWGGEEFLIICPEISINNAAHLAQTLRERTEKHSFGKAGKRTASFGVSELIPKDTKETLVSRADDAMYRAKESGRNRVEIIT